MQNTPLFTSTRLGDIELTHRVVMAPLTRMRAAQPGDRPTAMNADYYGQRASAGGLLITEATDISPTAKGYPWVPGIYSDAQIAGWKLVTDAVHAKGGFIFNQLWHVGRISHSSMQPGNALPVAPSAVAAPGVHMNADAAPADFETPRALETSEIPGLVAEFVQAARNSRAAGFDGVEVHGANGYLIDQFLRSNTNHRTDSYGGSIENRTRFLLEVVDAVAAAIGKGRVGVRISPWGTFNGADEEGIELWTHVVRELGKRDLAYLHLIEPRADFTSDGPLNDSAPNVSAQFRKLFPGAIISAGGYTAQTACEAVSEGRVQAVAFGRLFIANPDLPARIRLGAPLNAYDRPTFYGGAEKGYTDYPFLGAEVAA